MALGEGGSELSGQGQPAGAGPLQPDSGVRAQVQAGGVRLGSRVAAPPAALQKESSQPPWPAGTAPREAGSPRRVRQAVVRGKPGPWPVAVGVYHGRACPPTVARAPSRAPQALPGARGGTAALRRAARGRAASLRREPPAPVSPCATRERPPTPAALLRSVQNRQLRRDRARQWWPEAAGDAGGHGVMEPRGEQVGARRHNSTQPSPGRGSRVQVCVPPVSPQTPPLTLCCPPEAVLTRHGVTRSHMHHQGQCSRDPRCLPR